MNKARASACGLPVFRPHAETQDLACRALQGPALTQPVSPRAAIAAGFQPRHESWRADRYNHQRRINSLRMDFPAGLVTNT